MKGNTDWSRVESTAGGSSLAPGCYVCKIVDVTEGDPARSGAESLEIVYDIAEGPEAGHYSDEWGKNNAWAHTDRWYYGTEATNGMFRGRLDSLEKSNPSFKVAEFNNDETKLKGLLFGAGIQKRYYTHNGEDKEALEVVRIWDADYVRDGKAKLPEPRDDRKKQEAPAQPVASASAYDGNLPF